MSDSQSVDVRFLSQEEGVEAGVVDMDGCVETMEYVFELYNQGRVAMGDPGQDMHGHVTTFPGELENAAGVGGGPDRRFSAMPAYVGGDIHKAGIKWYGSNVENPAERGIPRSLHTITLNDPESGKPLAVMDGQVVSAMRTGWKVKSFGEARDARWYTLSTAGNPSFSRTSASMSLKRGFSRSEEMFSRRPLPKLSTQNTSYPSAMRDSLR